MYRMAVSRRERGVKIVARIRALVVLVIALAGCMASAPSRTINGWAIGDVWKCTNPYCDSARQAAEAGLDERYPGHPAVASLTFHWEGHYRRPDGRLETGGHPAEGCCEIAVYQFADGTAVAFGIGHGVTGDVARPYFDPPFGDPPFGVPAE